MLSPSSIFRALPPFLLHPASPFPPHATSHRGRRTSLEAVAETALHKLQVLHAASASGFPANSLLAPLVCRAQWKAGFRVRTCARLATYPGGRRPPPKQSQHHNYHARRTGPLLSGGVAARRAVVLLVVERPPAAPTADRVRLDVAQTCGEMK